jgi:hypothetical protein
MVVALILILAIGPLNGEEFRISFKNSFVLQGIRPWGVNVPDVIAGLAWRPELFGEYFPATDWRLSAEVSMDNRLDMTFNNSESTQDLTLALYRAWTAASWKNTEVKAGLQHIRMGTAQIYRPLQWFDDITPASFLQLSQGVKAITLTHYFPNPEIRLWAMPVIGETIHVEFYPLREGSWELGGRVGLQNPLGETGLSFNRREWEVPSYSDDKTEYQIGLDHRVDGFMGAWLEADISILDNIACYDEGGVPDCKYWGAATLGGDYTFGIGNGLYALAEINMPWALLMPYIDDETSNFYNDWRGALLLTYPLGVLDGLQLLCSYEHTYYNNLTSVISWRRTYDRLSWDLSLGLTSIDIHTGESPGYINLTIKYDI